MVDKYTNRWEESNQFDSLYEAKARLKDLVSFLNSAQFPYTLSGTPPVDLVLSIVKEILYYSIYSFGCEIKDIRPRNLELRFEDRPEIFHTLNGTREIDTGLPRTIKFGRRPIIFLQNEVLQEFLTNILQDLIDIEEIFINQGKSPSLEDLEEILKIRRRKPIQSRPALPSEREIALRLQLLAKEKEILLLKRRLKNVMTKFYSKRSKRSSITRKSRNPTQ